MNSKNGNNKLGLKTAVSRVDSDLEKLKKENAILKKKLEESSKSKLSGAERNRLLEAPPKTEDVNSVHILEAQLKDALEKNRQWLVYDQQREAYVQGLIAQIVDLEQQVANAKQTQQEKESNSDAKEDKQKYYDRLLLAAKKDLEGERQITAQLNSELSAMRMKYEEKKKELENVSATLKSLRESEKGQREDDRRRFKEKMQRLKDELDLYREKYEEEKKKNWDLSNQIQRCTSDLENGKIDQQNVQQQLNKVLKELRKTREQITKLEPADVQVCTLIWPTVAEEIAWDISFIVLDFLIPGLSIIVSYTKIFKITKEIRERVTSSAAYSEVHQYRVSQRDYRLFRTLFILMISFFVMWTPVFIIVLLLLLHNLTKTFILSPTVFFWILAFTFCNSIVNPILYNINLLKQKWWRVIFCGNPEDNVDTETTNKPNDNRKGTSDTK